MGFIGDDVVCTGAESRVLLIRKLVELSGFVLVVGDGNILGFPTSVMDGDG